MRKIWIVAKRELMTYLQTPMAYALMAGFLMITGYFFSMSLLGSRAASVQSMLGNAGLILVFVAPILTMRLLADEDRQGTSEILFTTPVSVGQVVVGKFAGALMIMTALLLIMLVFPLVVDQFGNPDWGVVLSGYFGFWLMMTAFLAAGVFTSSLTDSQLVAGVAGVALLLLLWVIDWAAGSLGAPIGPILARLSITNHFVEFNRGIIDTKNIVFYLSLTFGFLFLGTRIVESRRWR